MLVTTGAHNKLEAVFVVRIPTKLDLARIVPGRENVFILAVCGGFRFNNPNV